MRDFTYGYKTVQVSEDGQIFYKGKRISQSDNGHGYMSTTILYKKFYVHRIVMEAYNGPPPLPKMDVNHKNGIKNDNRPENLEWCNRSFNLKHSYDFLGRKPPCAQLGKSGFLHHRSKAVLSVKETCVVEHGSMRECAQYFNVGKTTIYNYIDKVIPYEGVFFYTL